jgi:TonB family protein
MRIMTFALALVASLAIAPLASRGQEAIYEASRDSGVSLPKPIRQVKPQYTPRAMQDQVQGTVWVKCVVRTTGKPTDFEVVKVLDPELDDQAIEALRQWEFVPGQREGKAVSVRITVEMTFTLK